MYKVNRPTLITLIAASFLTGLWLAHLGVRLPVMVLPLAAIMAVCLSRGRLGLLAILAAVFCFGLWYSARSDLAYQSLRSQIGRSVALTGRVQDDPGLSVHDYWQFTLGDLHESGRSIAGHVKITTTNGHLQRGYLVSAKGKLQPGFASLQASQFATVTVVSDHQDWLERGRQHFIAGLRSALPSPLSELGLGLLIGSRTLLPKALQDQLAAVGLSHLIAVSGYNLTILVNAAYQPLRRHSRFLSHAAAVWLVLGFLAVSGFSASVVRAAVVSGLSLLTSYYGRKPHPMTLLSLAAIATTAGRPEYLWSDLGWQLSFLAFFGILVLAPALEKLFFKTSGGFKRFGLECLCAQILTLPLIALAFGQVALFGPLANLIVLPLVPAAMLAGFAAGLAGWLAPAVAGWLSWPALWLLTAIWRVVDWLASRPGAVWQAGVSTAALAATYGLLAVLTLVIYRRLASTEPPTV